MRDKTFIKKLYEELPGLVADQVIDIDAAKRIMDHYGPEEKYGSRLIILAFSILGALFIGGGVILLIAHNWNELGRGVRAALSFAPLVTAQALAVYMILSEERRKSPAWREGVGTGWNLAVAAAIALVSQTYNLGGTMEDYLFTWAVLTLPIAYVARSSVSLTFTLYIVSFWRFEAIGGSSAWLYWPLIAACLPHIITEYRKKNVRAFTGFMVFTFIYAVAAGVIGITVKSPLEHLRIGMLFTVAGGIYLFGRWLNAGEEERPLHPTPCNLGELGLIVLVFVFSYDDTWRILKDGFGPLKGNTFELAGVLLAFALLWLFGIWKAWERSDRQAFILGLLPLAAWGLSALALYGKAFKLAAIIDNLYGFLAGVIFIYLGDREGSLAKTNIGMFLVAGLAFLRFVDRSQSIILRALVLIAIGIAFLAVNLRLAKRSKAA